MIIITSVLLCTDIDANDTPHIAVAEVVGDYKYRLRRLSNLCVAEDLFQAVVHDGSFSYINLTDIADEPSSKVFSVDDLLAHEIVTDMNYLHTEKDTFKHCCTERHCDVDEMFQTPDIPLDVLGSTADVVVVKVADTGGAVVTHLSANELTTDVLLDAGGLL